MKTKQKLVKKLALGLFLLALTFNIGITTQNENSSDVATFSLETLKAQAQAQTSESSKKKVDADADFKKEKTVKIIKIPKGAKVTFKDKNGNEVTIDNTKGTDTVTYREKDKKESGNGSVNF